MKQTPKSCSCRNCLRGKHSPNGHFFMKALERGSRHAAKVALKKSEDPVLNPGPIGQYFD